MSPNPMRRNRLRVAASALALTLFVPATSAAVPDRAVAAPGDPAHFIVLGPAGAGLETTEDSIESTGGRVVRTWPEIGVVLATSTDSGFAADVRDEPGVDGAGASRNLAEQLPDEQASSRLESVQGTVGPTTMAASEGEPLAPEQWDMRMINAQRAHEVSPGSEDITVGILDSGIDPNHPDLAPNLDESRSVGCTDNGVPDTATEAWAPSTSDHGTHVAGTVAAARNGVGVAGVARTSRWCRSRSSTTRG